jgi:hypothetical protein
MADDDIDTEAAAGNLDVTDFYHPEEDIVALPEGDRLKFAKQILFFLLAFSLFVVLISYVAIAWDNTNKELVALVDTVLDVTKTVVPSTVTLVLGFYFGKTKG